MTIQFYITALIVLFIIVAIFSILTYKVTKENFAKEIKLDISLEQMIQVESMISSFFEKNNLVQDGTLESIADFFNVERGGVEYGLAEQAYLKELDNSGKKIVLFKEGLSETEEQFVYAHELAHLLNGDAIPVTRPDSKNKAQIEQIADYTAAALLMPIEPVHSYLIQNHYVESSAKKRMRLIRGLCKQYGVTDVIALRRVKEIFAIKQSNVII